MNISLSKNEQIILCVVIVIAILTAGVLIFLWPEFENMQDNQRILEAKRGELAELQEKLSLDKFKEVEAQIMVAFEEGRAAGMHFHNEAFADYAADRHMRRILAELGHELTNLDINRLQAYEITMDKLFSEEIMYEIGGMANDRPDVTNDDEEGEGETAATEGEDGDDTVIVGGGAQPPEDVSDTIALKQFFRSSSRPTVLPFFNEMPKTPDMVEGMREFLSLESEIVLAQHMRFEIPLTDDEAHQLSTHIFNIDRATYIASMSVENRNAVTGEDDNNDDDSDRRLRVVELFFFVVHPLPQPVFDYEERFEWT
jgi:hypothetical protein